MKWNVYGPRDIGSVWADELALIGLSDIEYRMITELQVGQSCLDTTDSIWCRVH